MKYISKNPHYKWVILLCGIIITACGTGILSYFNALFVDPVTAALGVSKTSLMLYSTIATITTMITMPIVGRLYRRFPIKPLMIVGTVFGAGALFLYSLSSTVYRFYIGGFMAGMSMTLCGALPMTMVINNWFEQWRGTVTGIAYTGSALISAILSPTVSSIINQAGYASAYRFLGTLYLGLMLPMILVLLQTAPDPSATQVHMSSERQIEEDGPSCAQVLRSPSFWAFGAGTFLLGFLTYGTQSHLVAHWINIGIDAAFAAKLYVIVMFFSAFSKLFLGTLFDRFGFAKGTALLSTISVAAFFSLATISSSQYAPISASLFGMMTSLQVLVPSYGVAHMFGQREYSVLFGYMNTFLFLGVSAGVTVSAYVYDSFGRYHPAWWMYSFLMLTCLGLLLWANFNSQKLYFRSTEKRDL